MPEICRTFFASSLRVMPRIPFGLGVLAGLMLHLVVFEQEPHAQQQQVPVPHREQIPRVSAKTPTEAVKTFQVAKGFHMDLLVHEPLVTSPVAVAYDEDGRMYVAEMVDFPFGKKTGEKPNGRVRVVVDKDGDGTFDTSSIFVDGLSSPSSVVCWKGGVFVATLGDIWYFKDSTGSGQADVRRKVFTGFGIGSLEYMQNGLAWGIDHKIYGST